jgi:fructose-1,6-bisphosphatase/inositol monophosphatase family enzyme
MELENLLQTLKTIGYSIRDRLVMSINIQAIEVKSQIHKIGNDDIIYKIDKDVEDLILEGLEEVANSLGGVVVIAEGLENQQNCIVLPKGFGKTDAKFLVIIDPIDGTRGLMYDKRSAFFLAGVAYNQNNATLKDIVAAIMIELPTSKAYLADSFSAVKGQGVKGWRTNLLNNQEENLIPRPSTATTIFGGFAQFSRFFSPGKEEISVIEETITSELFPYAPEGKAYIFEDQYISTGGQFYEILMGHDRFIADIRGALFNKYQSEGKKVGLGCHPYDVCSALILQEAGIEIVDLHGQPLDCPLDTTTNVDWVAFANKSIKKEVWNTMHRTFISHNLI